MRAVIQQITDKNKYSFLLPSQEVSLPLCLHAKKYNLFLKIYIYDSRHCMNYWNKLTKDNWKIQTTLALIGYKQYLLAVYLMVSALIVLEMYFPSLYNIRSEVTSI